MFEDPNKSRFKTGEQFYLIKSGKVRKLVDKFFEEREEVFKDVSRFSKKHGADPKEFFIRDDSDGYECVGLLFRKQPDRKYWKISLDAPSYDKKGRLYCARPKKNTKIGKAMFEEFDEIRSASLIPLQEELNWSPVFYKNYMVPFNHFAKIKDKIFGFVLPKINDVIEPEDINLKGCVEIERSEYEGMFEDG